MHEPRFEAFAGQDACRGRVRWSPTTSIWVTSMLLVTCLAGPVTLAADTLLVFATTTAMTLCLGHSLGMHRLLIHRSYATCKPLEYALVWLGVLVGLAGPLGMMRTHDLRDWAQRQARCHDYFGHRRRWYQDAWWQLHCRLELAAPPTFRPERAVSEDPVYRFLERTWMAQQLIPAALLFACGGWGWVVWGVCARVTVSVGGHWLIGYFAHNDGHQSWRVAGAGVQGFNLPFWSLLTFGESWHNNHHAFPGSAKLGLHAGELDPGWWVLKALAAAGLVWNLRLPEDLPPRAELRPVGPRTRQACASFEPNRNRYPGAVGFAASGGTTKLTENARRRQ
ncbi:MAG: acyl-CoA desaturase [Pseudomonadota bacterium]